MTSRRRIRWVAIGGGTGLATLLSGLRTKLDDIDLTAVVAVTDDGSSSGRLRGEFNVLPPGDIRNCLVALSDPTHLMTRLFRHRFPGEGELGGHSLGNLILVAISQISGDLLAATETAQALLGVNARILPATLDAVDLVARIGGHEVRGQTAIKSQFAPIDHLRIAPANARALEPAIQAIREADLITLGPGSLYTSVIANLLIDEIREALDTSRAKKVYVCNIMTEANETDGLSALDHITQVVSYSGNVKIDYALFNSSPISAEMRDRYATENATALAPPALIPSDLNVQLISLPLASEDRFVRHDPERLRHAIMELYSSGQWSVASQGAGAAREVIDQGGTPTTDH